jgi:tRNA(adenine34) deaminase
MDVRPLDERAMDEALRLAGATGRMGNVPVGAVIVVDDTIVAAAANLRETLQDPTAHAELLVLREAAARQGSWRLEGATMIVTLEPCAMCAAAIDQARIRRVVYGADEPKTGAVMNGPRLLDNRPIEIERGLRADESLTLLENFFKKIRGRE